MTSANDLHALRVDSATAAAGGAEYERHILHTIKILGGYSQKELVKAVDTGLLGQLDPFLDTIPYLFALAARVHASTARNQFADDLFPGNTTWTRLVDFLESYNPLEIRYAGDTWVDLVTVLLESRQNGTTSTSAPILITAVTALLRLDPKGCTLTSLHLDLVHEALITKRPDQILPLLDNDITHLPSQSSVNADGYLPCSPACPSHLFINADSRLGGKTITLSMVHEYFIKAALSYLMMQNWRRAIFCLEHVLTTPCGNNPNSRMVEAYKKWALLNVLAYGKERGLPRGINGTTAKTLKNASKPYDALAETFTKSDYRKLLAQVDEGTQFWTDDNNVGLVQRVLADHQRRSVTGLGKIYAALPLSQVASSIGMAETDMSRYLGRLIEDGTLNARLERNEELGEILRFENDGVAEGPVKSEAELRQQLVEQTKRIRILAEDIGDVDHLLSMNKAYLDSARKAKNRKNDPTATSEEQAEMFPTGMDSDDEDVMADA